MNTKELVEEVAKISGMRKKETRDMMVVFSEILKESLLANKKVVFSGFGSFEILNKKARAGINPKTLAKITIPAKSVVKFKPSKKLKSLLN
jgi:DNA-binding protein HU-beta